ncbi:LysE family translocator [Acuticoccus sp. I52.16.1]|uniref:LysE family translocator n=1 Tax=Acuticoccus sp. I52.16.1 TaxID=2928472 RepID=UPI001FD0705A|nr:LysE family translocator [Acuticoccus sp. I52.16.1]UOM33728.1 LysE family translocator [Acuticoccus sp. I52.16.1]
MLDLSVLATFAVASAALAVVPGPTVTLIVANSLRRGPMAGLANVLGTQLGVATMMLVLMAGLDAIVALIGEAFVVLKLLGAAYLVWLGIKHLRSDGRLERMEGDARSMAGYAVQGFFVIWSNPKALLFFGAFIPQFVDRTEPVWLQIAVLGGIFMLVASVFDSIYALLAGRAGAVLTRPRVRFVERVAGGLMVAGGTALAFARR